MKRYVALYLPITFSLSTVWHYVFVLGLWVYSNEINLYLSLTENKLLGEKVMMTGCFDSLWEMSFPKSSPSDKPVLASEWLSDLLLLWYFLLVKYFQQLLASSKYEGLKNHYGEIWDKGNQKLGTQIRMDGGLWWSFLVSHFKNIGIVSAIVTVLYLCKSQKLKYVWVNIQF